MKATVKNSFKVDRFIADEFQVFYDVRSYSGKTALSVKVTECKVIQLVRSFFVG